MLHLPIPPYFVGEESKIEIIPGNSRFANASRTWLAAAAISITNVSATEVIVAYSYGSSPAMATGATTVQLQWRNLTDLTSWVDLSGSGELTWTATTDLVNGNAVTSGESGCDAPSGDANYVDGIEREGGNQVIVSLPGDTDWTEAHWAVSLSNALAGKEYEFRLYDVVEGAAESAAAATLTMASSIVPIAMHSRRMRIN